MGCAVHDKNGAKLRVQYDNKKKKFFFFLDLGGSEEPETGGRKVGDNLMQTNKRKIGNLTVTGNSRTQSQQTQQTQPKPGNR